MFLNRCLLLWFSLPANVTCAHIPKKESNKIKASATLLNWQQKRKKRKLPKNTESYKKRRYCQHKDESKFYSSIVLIFQHLFNLHSAIRISQKRSVLFLFFSLLFSWCFAFHIRASRLLVHIKIIWILKYMQISITLI